MTPCLTIAGSSGSIRHVIRVFGTAAAGTPEGPSSIFITWCGQRRANAMNAAVEFLPVFTHPDVLRVAMDVLQQAGVAVDPAVLQLLLPSAPVAYGVAPALGDGKRRQQRAELDARLFGNALAEVKELRQRIARLTAAQAAKAVFASALMIKAQERDRRFDEAPAFKDLFWPRRWADFVDALLPYATDEFKIDMVRIMAEEDEKGVLRNATARMLFSTGPGMQKKEPSVAAPTLCDACRLAFASALLEEWM